MIPARRVLAILLSVVCIAPLGRADIPPRDQGGCTAQSTGRACIMDNGTPGTCQPTTCTRYEMRPVEARPEPVPPPGTVAPPQQPSYPSFERVPVSAPCGTCVASATPPARTTGSRCSTHPGTPYMPVACAAVLVALFALRRRSYPGGTHAQTPRALAERE